MNLNKLIPFLSSGILAAGIYGLVALYDYRNHPLEKVEQQISAPLLSEPQQSTEACLNEKTLPRILREQIERFGIVYDSLPVIEVDTEFKEVGPLEEAAYNEERERIRVTPFMQCPDSSEGEKRTVIEELSDETLHHELCHAYAHQRTKKLLWLSARIFAPTEEEIRVREAYDALVKDIPSMWTTEYTSWTNRVEEFNVLHQRELTNLVFIRMMTEGISQYCSGDETFPIFDGNWPESFLTIHYEDFGKLFYSGGSHFIEPLVREFGVQPVVDYIVTHEPEVSGNLREDVLRYQKQVQDALRGQP